MVDVHEPAELDPQKPHDIEAVIDRVVIREGVRDRLAESINLAVEHGDGAVLAAYEEKTKSGSRWHDRLFSTLYACPNCKISYEELEPRTFSFNSPYGACPKCEGLGVRARFRSGVDPARLEFIAGGRGHRAVERRHGGGDAKNPTPPAPVFDQDRHPLEYAPGKTFAQGPRTVALRQTASEFEGVLIMLEKEYVTTTSETKRQRLETFRAEMVCDQCGGARLRARSPGRVRCRQGYSPGDRA